MTEDELRAIERRWENGAQVEVHYPPDGINRLGFRVPYAGDVPALIAEVRRLGAALEHWRQEREEIDAVLGLRAGYVGRTLPEEVRKLHDEITELRTEFGSCDRCGARWDDADGHGPGCQFRKVDG